jgi:hypothetical protein
MSDRKNRGAQPGNQNARKHGFYSTHFKQREKQILDTLEPSDISAEIELIRVTCSRFLQAWNDSHHRPDLESSLVALRAVNLSAHTIAMLLRVQSITGAPRQELEDLLKELEVDESQAGAGDTAAFGSVPNDPLPV